MPLMLLPFAAATLGLSPAPPAPAVGAPTSATVPAALPAAAQSPLMTPEMAPELPADAVVDGTLDRYSRLTVPVTIGGQGPFRFMIDTGSQATVITSMLRDRLGLRSLGRATVVGMAARREVELVELDGLEFAERVFDALQTPILEAQHIGADGILGLDSLQNLRVVIDFRAATLAVDDARSLGGNKGYEIVVRARSKLGRLIITDAQVDGIRTAVIIDTGSQGSMGNLALHRRLRAKGTSVVTSTDVTGGTITGRLGFVKQLSIAGSGARQMRLSGLPIGFADSPAFAALGLADKPALVLGIEDLRLMNRVAIDFAQRSVLFDLPAGSETGVSLPDGMSRL